MRWYGKVLGFIAGWLLLRHPAGALLGLLIGHAFDADWFQLTRKRRDEPYRVLGVHPDASDAEIERAWRRLMAQHHPDRLVGAEPEVRARAEERARAVNAAFDAIQKQRRRQRR
ncbi:J domain-containing protein [Coralloluteibacterium stylophorae]|uniref:DnaJ domain-containing protein n=1 Tax=Coralloluteibacterium stylophorae TaxID=1776034 RepID=A0A8J7VUD5_9GAMM|nr:DnaJ domain-containing protein [Coralloluteibacterium stylophorae]MBS7457872.1 DnaJ domain-containing protein [Coralloluteibacterium stylophorae]